MKTALVLAGHGSHISPETAGLVWSHVDELRAMGVADEVTAAFWKEMPSFHTVFNSLEADDITVVPLFTAQGYFTQTVIPSEMRIEGKISQVDSRIVRYARTLSEHPYLGQVVQQRVEQALASIPDQQPEQVAVAIIGHSTRRNPESRKATEAQADAIHALGLASEVLAVYLDDSPAIADVYDLTCAPNLIVVPHFLASGSHTTIDVPRELGLSLKEGRTGMVKGRQVYYTEPVGVEDDLRGAVLELAREAGMPFKPPHAGSNWNCFPLHALDVSAALLEQGEVVVGQLRITAKEVLHVDDDQPTETIDDPGDLRQRVRDNPFRPLATSTDLPGGWRVPVHNDSSRLHAIIETIYPNVLGIAGSDKSSLAATLARQTGRYRKLKHLDAAAQQALVQRVCGKCVRRPLWADAEVKPGDLLCPEPCDFWLSSALKTLEGDADE